MLNPRQQAFVNEYLVSGNATEAYMKAYGVSEKVAGVNASRLLGNARIVEHIENFTRGMTEHTKLSIEQMVADLHRIVTADIRKAYNEDGSLKGPHDIDDHTAFALSEYSEVDNKYGTARKIRMYSKLDAIDKLLRVLGGYVTAEMLIDRLTPDQLEGLYQKIIQNVKDNDSERKAS